MKKILIIGKKSFVGSNLKKYLSKFFKVDHLSFEKKLKFIETERPADFIVVRPSNDRHSHPVTFHELV